MTLSIRFLLLPVAVLFLSVSPAVSQKKKVSAKPLSVQLPQRPLVTPARLHFSGEIVPTEQGDVSTKLASALASRSGYARHVNSLKARSAPFFAVIEPILHQYNIPNDFKYMPLIESAWQAKAVSSAGAVGYWQFMDETAQDMGLSIEPDNDERSDLRKSTEAACKYLKFLHRKLGSWTLVAAAYNGGVGMVQRKIVRAGHRDYYAMAMNPETGYYLYRILAMKELFTNPSYGAGSVGIMLASGGNLYDQEREQARRMGWLRDDEPEPTGIPIEPLPSPVGITSEDSVMDSVLTELLKNKRVAASVFVGDVAARLVRAGQPKIGQSWTFALTEPMQIGEEQLNAGDALYAVVDDIDSRGILFLRATKVICRQTNTPIPLTLIAIDPATGMAGIARPKAVKAGWLVQWKL